MDFLLNESKREVEFSTYHWISQMVCENFPLTHISKSVCVRTCTGRYDPIIPVIYLHKI